MSVRRNSSLVILGAGVTGSNAALELRRLGFDGNLTLVTLEPKGKEAAQ